MSRGPRRGGGQSMNKDRTREREEWRHAVLGAIACGALPATTMVVAFYVSFKIHSKLQVAWTSQATIARAVGLKESTVRKLIGLLRDRGFLHVTRAKRTMTNRYSLACPATAAQGPHQGCQTIGIRRRSDRDARSGRKLHADSGATGAHIAPISLSDLINSSLSRFQAEPANGDGLADGCMRLGEEEAGGPEVAPQGQRLSREDGRRRMAQLKADMGW